MLGDLFNGMHSCGNGLEVEVLSVVNACGRSGLVQVDFNFSSGKLPVAGLLKGANRAAQFLATRIDHATVVKNTLVEPIGSPGERGLAGWFA